jgi:hypothetical protein
MSKIHSDSDVTITFTFSGLTVSGAEYLHDNSVAAIEKIKLRHAEDFYRLVKRHVEPHAEGMYMTARRIDRKFACSACKRPWTEESDTYNGGCCAVDEPNNSQPEAAT